MCTTKFYLDTRSKKDKKKVIMRVNHASKAFNKGTGIDILPQDWDGNLGFPMDKTSPEFVELAALEKLVERSYEVLKDSLRSKPTMEELKASIETVMEKGEEESIDTISGMITAFIDQKFSIYNHSTIRDYIMLKALVVKKFYETLDDQVDHLNKTWALKFIDHLCYEEGYQNSTVEMYLKKLNSVLNFFDKPTIKISEVMKGMKKGKTVNGDKPYLTFHQINELEEFVMSKYDLSKSSYDIWCLFVWCCYTGMRYNEAIDVTCEMVKDGVLTYTTTKNGRRISVPLNEWCMDLVKSREEGRLFDERITNAKCNTVLTNLLIEYGMTTTTPYVRFSGKNRVITDKSMAELISFHSSRRSFVSNLLDNGIPIKDVALVTGISASTLINYYASSNQDEVNSKVLEVLNR